MKVSEHSQLPEHNKIIKKKVISSSAKETLKKDIIENLYTKKKN